MRSEHANRKRCVRDLQRVQECGYKPDVHARPDKASREIESAIPPNGGWRVVPMFRRIAAKDLTHGGNVFRWLFENQHRAGVHRWTCGVTCAVKLI
jgi:hypothetical protein